MTAADEFGELFRHALELADPSLIVLDIDYDIEAAIADGLGEETLHT